MAKSCGGTDQVVGNRSFVSSQCTTKFNNPQRYQLQPSSQPEIHQTYHNSPSHHHLNRGCATRQLVNSLLTNWRVSAVEPKKPQAILQVKG